MISRCYYKQDDSYPYYGGRGLGVCEFLRASPANLLALVGDKPKGKSIDRPNNNSGYHCGSCAECAMNGWPKNIRWATPREQVRNRRNTIRITFNGKTQCAAEWAEELRIPIWRIQRRYKSGLRGYKLLCKSLRNPPMFAVRGLRMSVVQIARKYGLKPETVESRTRAGCQGDEIIRPVRKRNRTATIAGQTKTLKEWARRSGINYYTIHRRYQKGARGLELIAKIKPEMLNL